MGSGLSTKSSRKWRGKKALPPQAESSRVLFLLYLIHRTWNIMIEHVDSKSARWRGSNAAASSGMADLARRRDSISLESDISSCFSGCGCSYCQLRGCAHDCVSELILLEGMANCGGWSEEPVSKDKQRPPIYNPEDYVTSLKKWGKKICGGSLYDMEPGQESNKASTLPNQSNKDFRNPCLIPGEEMSLRQFGTASELLTKLRADLRLSFPSFVQEFTSEPLDGVALLLELLRNVQLSQTEGARGPPAVRRRPLLDELACLQCIWSCCSRYPECVRRLVVASHGVYTLTACIMSTVNKSRVLALQLLTKACYPPAEGHTMVSEAMSTLRLRYGEPVRFRFLVGMLQSAAGTGDLQAAGMAFINALLTSAPTPQRKLYIQAELEQAGFDVFTLKKMVTQLSSNELVTREIEYYEKELIDIDTLNEKANEAQKEKDDLRHKLDLLEKRVKILQEEKGILLSLEKCLKEKCCELQEEVSSLRSEHGNSNRKKIIPMKKKNILSANKDESSPPEDEGISSSERSLSPEGDIQRDSMIYEVFNMTNDTYDIIRNKRSLHKKLENNKSRCDDRIPSEDEETTIDEVIQELRNLVNDAESEQFSKKKASSSNSLSNKNLDDKSSSLEIPQLQKLEKEDSITSTRHNIHIGSSSEFLTEKVDEDEELEIVPSKILPHPPRRTKSLLHLYMPHMGEGVGYSKSPDVYDDPYFSSDEGSDSLLSASRCENNVAKNDSGTSFDFNQCRAKFSSMIERDKERSRTRYREDSNKVKRSESFQNSEKGSRQREYIDSMFYTENSRRAISLTPVQRSSVKVNRVDEIVNLIESKKLTKSLDRIEEGLNSMVDIVMAAEPKEKSKSYEKRQRSPLQTCSVLGNETPLMQLNKPNSRINVIFQHDRKEQFILPEIPQKFFLPHSKMKTSTFESQSGFNSGTFLVKRGHCNGGFYTSHHMMRDAPASMTSLVMTGTHSHSDLKRTLSPMGSSSSRSMHKVTDVTSGLY